jgi:hypothetical protein
MEQLEKKSYRYDELHTEACKRESTTSGMLEAKFGILLAQLNQTTDPSMRLILLEKLHQVQQKLDRSSLKAHA